MTDQELEHLLFVDECTRTYNRRYFFQRLEEEVARAKRYGRNFSLLFTDVDRFKEINDAFGHLAGDDVLREVATRLRDIVRGVDLVFRYAGDEFAVILPETSSRQAVIAAERLLEAFRRNPVYVPRLRKDLHVTLSVGTASFPADGGDATAILENADKALLAAKARGRDQVCDQERARETNVSDDQLARPVFCPRMVGREKERRALRKAFARAVGGRGSFVLIAGETGVGKTRLVRDFGEFARLQGAVTAYGVSFEEPTGFAYQPFREAVAAYVTADAAAAKVMARIPRSYRRELCHVVPELAAFGFEDAPLLEISPEQARLRLFVGFRYLFSAIAAARPLALVLEDLHWAEEGTLALCRFLVNGLAAENIIIIGTYRPEELAGRGDGAKDALAGLAKDRTVETVKLGRLSRDAVEEMLRLIFRAPRISARFLDFIFRETEGNPLFVEEILKAFYEEGLPPRRYVIDGEPVPEGFLPPGTIKGIIKRRLARTDEQVMEVLQAAALVGEEFAVEGVRAAVSRNEGLLNDVFERCVDQELLLRAGPDRYRFSHGQVRDEVIRAIPKRRRKWLHKKLAGYYEQKYREGEEGSLSDLSWHAFGGELWEKVLVYAKLAGDKAWGVYDAAEALKHYNRMADAVGHVGQGGFGDELIRREAVELHTRRGEIYLMMGKFAAAAEVFEKAKLIAGEMGDDLALGRAMNMAARAYGLWGEERHVLPNLEGALRIFKKYDATADLARVFYDLGEHHRRVFNVSRALSYLHMAETVAERVNDGHLSMTIARSVGEALMSRGDVRGASGYFKLALAWARGLGDRWGEATSLSHLGEAAFRAGRLREAGKYLGAAYEDAAALGHRPLMAATLIRLGNASLYGGDTAGAAPYFTRAVAAAREAGDKRGEAQGLYRLGLAHYRQGRVKEAAQEWKEAAAGATRGRDNLLIFRIRLAQAEAAAVAGSQRRASRLLQQATAAVGDLTAHNLAAAYYLASGRVKMAGGDGAGAWQDFTAAAQAARADSDVPVLGWALLRASLAAATAGEVARARKALKDALALARGFPKTSWEGVYLWAKGQAAAAEGKTPLAKRYFDRAVAVLSERDVPAAAMAQAAYGEYLATTKSREMATAVLKSAATNLELLGNPRRATSLRKRASA